MRHLKKSGIKMKEICSEANPNYRHWLKLLQAKKYRIKDQSYIAEGINVLDIPKDKIKTYILPTNQKNKIREWELPEDKITLLAESLFKKLSQDVTSQGLLAWVAMADHSWQPCQWQKMKSGLYLAVEDIQDAGNLGTMIRTAEAAGARAVFCSSATVDIYHPKVIKAAASSLSRLQVVTNVDLLELIEIADKNHISSYAATPAQAVEYHSIDYRRGGLVLIGNEGNGLSTQILQKASKRIFISMDGQIESLNAAISAGIIMFEIKKYLK